MSLFIDRIKGIFNKKQHYNAARYRQNERLSDIENFLTKFPVQFVLGHVIECITNRNSIIGLKKDSNINAIKALKHTESVIDSNNIEALQSEIYFPLLRGITDTPTQGDPVLLCEFAGRKYYFGPLNTINSPNWNPDVMLKTDKTFPDPIGEADYTLDLLQSLNVNPHFKATNTIKRLHKPITSMDYAIKDNSGPFNRSVGDLMLEGRFGNSIRIGNRSGRPNIFISNGRNAKNRAESLNDGCLITMTSVGSLKHHFSYPTPADGNIEQDLELPSNKDNKTSRRIDFNNEYDASQIVILSNRLVLGARSDKILLSSRFNVEIGSGKDFKILTRNDTIIDSDNIYLGRPYDKNNSYEMSSAVLGNELIQVLQEIIDAIGKCNVGMTQPLGFTSTIDSTTVASGGIMGTGWAELKSIKKNLKRILSNHVKIGLDKNWN